MRTQARSWPKLLGGWLVQVSDLLVLSAAYTGDFLSQGMRFEVPEQGRRWMLAVALLCLAIWRVILVWSEMYRRRLRRSILDYVLRCLIALNVCALVAGLGSRLTAAASGAVPHVRHSLWLGVAAFWTMSLAGMAAVRIAALVLAGQISSHSRASRNFIVVGSGARARRIAKDRLADQGQEYRLLGYVNVESQRGFVPEAMLLGHIEELERILGEKEVDEVLIALPMKSQYETIGRVIATCQKINVQSRYISEMTGETSFTD